MKLFILMAVAAVPLFGQNALDVPESVHVPILLKSLPYDNKLKGANLMILARTDENSNKNQASTQFSGKTVKSNAMQVFDGVYSGKANLQAIIDNLDVHLIYLCTDLTDAQVTEIGTICNQKSILTMTGVPKFVQSGLVSLSVTKNENNKPKILLNKQKMRFEGHFFSTQFLQLCKIVE